MIDAETIAERFRKTLFDPVNGFVVDGAGRIADRDVPRLIGISKTKALELREAGDAWPRHGGLSIDKCLYSVFVDELAQWYAEQFSDAS